MMTYNDNLLGPIGLADHDLLMTVARYYHEPSVLEFGSAEGHSAQAWIDGGAKLVHCVDINLTQSMDRVAKENQSKITFFHSDQSAFVPQISYDIIFFDASHRLDANIATFNNCKNNLLDGGCLIVHDTAKWAARAMDETHRNFGGVIDQDGGMWHQPDEVKFVQWLREQGWGCVDFSSKTALRHGITFCQRP